MLLLAHDFNNLLEAPCPMHVLAQFYGVLVGGLDNLRQHQFISHLNDALRHVIAEGVHHQLEEVLNRIVKNDLENLLVLIVD